MKRVFEYNLVGCLALVMLVSCYRDKGNYDYESLNEISIDLPEEVSVQQGMELEVSPKLSFAIESNEENLSYEWYVTRATSVDSVSELLSTERNFKGHIDLPAGNTYPFNFKVKDNNTGLTYRKEIGLRVLTDYQPGYFLLEEKAGRGDISFYNTEKDTVYYDIFSKANPDVTLAANANNLYSMDYDGYIVSVGNQQTQVGAGNLSMVFGEDWGYVVDHRSMRVVSGIEQMFTEQPKRIRPQILVKDYSSPNFFLVNDGKLHRILQTSGQTVFGYEYKAMNDDYDLSFLGDGFYARGFMGVLCYDRQNGRFYDATPTMPTLDLVAIGANRSYVNKENPSDTILNPAKVNKDWELMGVAQGGNMNMYYFMFFDTGSEVCFARCEALNGNFKSGPLNFITDEICPGLKESPVFACPYGKNLPYYANGNELRLYDFNKNTSQGIYSFTTGEITAMIFIERTMQLVVATYDGSNGSLYLLDLDSTGLLKVDGAKLLKSDFGKIKKIVHKK